MTNADSIALFPTLLGHAQRHPGRAAIVTPDIQVDHGDLPRHIKAIAGALVDQGFDADAMTAVTVPDEVQHLLVTLALLCLGTPNISLGSFDDPANQRRIADQLGISQLIVPPEQQQHRAGINGLRRFWPRSGHPTRESSNDYLLTRRLTPDDKLFYRSTSGTTGVPKSFGSTTAHIMNMASWVAEDPGKACILRMSSVEHDASRVQQACSILAGRTAAILHPVTAANLAPFCARVGVTEIHGGTFYLASLLAVTPRPEHRLPAGTRFLTGASRVPGALRAAAMERLTPDLYVSYATSETSAISIAMPDEHAEWPEGV
jgi:acyl-CoA synthetase (AMP-forming)/AMP-acid ligase II